MGGKFHLKLNIDARPIANKYREGKMKRTLKRELKVPEIAKREALETSHYLCSIPGLKLEAYRLVVKPSLVRGRRKAGTWSMSVSESIRFAGEGHREVVLRDESCGVYCGLD
jgi:hypothetical protein